MNFSTDTILLVEDNEDDVFLMKRALKSGRIMNPVHVVEDGQEAIDYLGGQGQFADRAAFPYPGIVFLDLQLPRKSGFDVLEWFQAREDLPRAVIVVLSSSNSPRDTELSTRLGAAAYAIKPPGQDLFRKLAEQFGICWQTANAALR